MSDMNCLTEDHSLQTYFASAERADATVLEQQKSAVLFTELVDVFMQAVPGYVMLLNKHRQIVAVNAAVLCVTGASDISELIGKRPGEALNCIHACAAPSGCGTDEHCTVCGAVLAILESQTSNKPTSKECHVTLAGEYEIVQDLMAVATPVSIRGEKFTIFVLQDISGEKRREVLERIFFHDVINTAGGIHGLATMLVEHENIPAHVEAEYKKWLAVMSGNLVDEIHHQRKLLMAELGEFQPEVSTFSMKSLIDEVYQLYHNHDKVPGRTILISPFDDLHISTDHTVVRRIIGNMILNALEATPIGGVVTISIDKCAADVMIRVHNCGEMPLDVQLQLFKRSFSTKSPIGRGIGTYSMKLFGERYLKGSISFVSNEETGTIFTFRLPVA